MRAAFEAELKSIKVGQLDTSGLKAATGQAKALTAEMERAAKAGDLGGLDTSGLQRAGQEAAHLRQELEQAGRAATNIKAPTISSAPAAGLGGGGLGGLAGGLLGGFAAGAVIGQLKELGQALEDTARRGAIFTQLGDVLNSYTKSVGSSSQAFIKAGQEASQGTIAQYDLILNANRAIQFEVAKTSGQYAKLIELSSALGRAQGVSDAQALEYLTTGLARESRLILDNLGLIIDVDGATSAYAATLGKTKDELTAAERKTALLNEAFIQGATALEANRLALDSTATAIERYDANVQNLKDSFGKLTAEILNVPINRLAEFLGLTADYFEDGRGFSVDAKLNQIKNIKEGIAELQKLQFQPNAFGGQSETPGIAEDIEKQRKGIADLHAEILAMYEDMGGNPMSDTTLEDFTTKANTAAAAARLASEKLAEEQGTSINKGLASRSEKSVETLGPDRALELYKQAKTDAETAIKALVEAGVTDATEFGLRSEQIMLDLTARFDEAEAMANQIDFSALSTAFASLDTGFVDFLPGISAAREELASLSEEIAYSGGATDEQAARLEYLSAVAYSVGDSTSQLGQVTADLGYEFLSSNEYAAGLVDALYDAEASYRSGLISADTYAGVTAALSGKLLGLAQTAGIATGAIYALNSAQADMAATLPGGAQGRAVGDSIASRIQSRDSEKARDHNRRELDRYAKDQARATERSGARAGKALEDGAKKASQELKSALQGVEGLFGASKVTQEDMDAAKAGTYKDKADEYLRRFRDEVENGKDWADVSLEQVRAGLEKAGLDAGTTAKETLANFEQSINDSSLFSAAENIPIFINEKAVKYALALQEKSAQGEKNIFEYFGVKVDEAVSASTGGGGAVPVIRPPDLIDVDPITEGMQTGVDDLVQQTTNKLNEAFAATAGVDPVLGGIKTGGTAYPKTIDLVADSTVTALVPLLTPKTKAGTEATATVSPNAITPLLADLSTQIATQQPAIQAQGATIAQILMAGIAARFMGTQQAAGEGQAAMPLAEALITNLNAQFTAAQGAFAVVGFLPAQGIEYGFKVYAYEGLADSFIQKLTGEIRSNAATLGQRGGTMAGYVQNGFVAGFSSESFKAQLIAIGELMYTYIEIGILSKVNGSALTDAIGAKVIEDLATEMEKP